MLNFLSRLPEKYARWRLGGIPIMWIIYKPHLPVPNVVVNLHFEIEQDAELTRKFTELAEMIRERWQG